MSDKRSIAELMQAVGDDPELAAKFVDAATADEVVTIAADLGFDVTAEEVETAGTEMTTREVSEAELAGITGAGTASSMVAQTCPTGQCVSMYGIGCS